MKIENLLETLPEQYSQVDRELVMRAYRFAEQAHTGQKRASGEPYITHSLAVAAILSELRVPPAVVIAGLLHDTVEDTPVTLEQVRREFGDEVSALVDGVTKLTNLPRVARGDQHADEELMKVEALTGPPPKGDSRGRAASETADSSSRSRKRDLASETLRKTFLAMGEDVRVC